MGGPSDAKEGGSTTPAASQTTSNEATPSSVSSIAHIVQTVGNEENVKLSVEGGSQAPSLSINVSKSRTFSEVDHSTTDDSEASVAESSSPKHTAPLLPPRPRHASTTSIHIWDLSRPLVIRELTAYIAFCAEEEPVLVWFDRIRSHSFAVFATKAAAAKARDAIDGQVFPQKDLSRKPMKVDFVPTEKVREWIAKQEAASSPAVALQRWKIIYSGSGKDTTAELVLAGQDNEHTTSSPGDLPQHSTTAPEETAQPPAVKDPAREMRDAEASLRESALRLKLQSSMMKNRENKNKKSQPTPSKLQRTAALPRMFYSEAPPDVIQERLRNKKP